MFRFTFGVQYICSGRKSFADALAGIKSALVVTDKFLNSSGKISYVTELLDAQNIKYKIFDDLTPDPDINSIAACVKLTENFAPDGVIAFGGGSAIDVAKSARFFLQKTSDHGKLFIVIPTTSGTGSEVSPYSVITDRDANLKYPLEDNSLLPTIAVLDSELVKSIPPSLTADTGMDALTHAVEAFLSVNANDFSDAMAEKAARLILKNLPIAYHEPNNTEARAAVHHAATMAGVAFSNAGLGATHALAHAIGAKLHIPHGRANAILLPYVISFTAGCHGELTPAAKRYAELADVLGLGCNGIRQSALSVIRAIKTLNSRVKIPSSFRENNIDRKLFESQLDAMSEAAMGDSCMASAPVIFKKEEIKAIFQTAYYDRLVLPHR